MTRAPFIEALILIAALCLLAIPLKKLTSGQSIISNKKQAENVQTDSKQQEVACHFKLHASSTLKRVEIKMGEELLWKKEEGIEPSEEFEGKLAIVEGKSYLTVNAEFSEDVTEQAIRLEVWPEGIEEKMTTLWGQGSVLEEVEYAWPSQSLVKEVVK